MIAGGDATVPAIVGAVAALLTTLFSKWLDSRSVERRDQLAVRRQRDRDAKAEMADMERDREVLRDRVVTLQLENTALRATLIANKIELPNFVQKMTP